MGKEERANRLAEYVFGDRIEANLQKELAKRILLECGINKKCYVKQIREWSKQLTRKSGRKLMQKTLQKLKEWQILDKSKDQNGFYYYINTAGFKLFLKKMYSDLLAITK